MACIDIEWAATGAISIFDEARQLGFDLRKYNSQPQDVQRVIRKLTVDRVIRLIREAWRAAYDNDFAHSEDFNRISNGVYVISVGGGFAVKYVKRNSEVMYIGRGKIATRLRSHLENWIFDMSLSLSGVPFKFFIETVGDGRSKDAFKDFEHLMLDTFNNKFGEKPLINKIHARAGHIDMNSRAICLTHSTIGVRITCGKSVPSKSNAWFKQIRDE